MRFALLLALFVFAAAGALAQQRTPSDAEAQYILTEEWNALTGWLLIGERTVGRNLPPQDCKSEQISEHQFEFLLGSEKAGFVTIKYWDNAGDVLKTREHTIKEIVELAASGRLRKFTVLPTKAVDAEKIRTDIHGRTGCISYKIGRYEILRTLSNEAIRRGTHDLALVRVTYIVSYGELYARSAEGASIRLESARQADVLFRFDPVTKRWRYLAFDAANVGDEIKRVNIPRVLETLN